MRISTKVSFALSLASVLVIGGYGVFQLRQEASDLRAQVRREISLVATAVRVAVENALRDHQPNDIRETLAALESLDPDVDIFVFDAEHHLSAKSGATPPDDQSTELARLTDGSAVQETLRFTGHDELGEVVLVSPLRPDGHTQAGTLVLVRPLADVRRDLTHTRSSILLSVALLVAAIAALGYLLGIFYVSRPLATLVRAMRGVREGDLTTNLAQRSQDEVGALAAEFNAMVAALDSARVQLAREIESRRVLETGLQRVDKLVAIGQLSAGLAHEIGSPLQILNGRARALLSRAETTHELRRFAEVFAEQTDRITGIVERLLHVARRAPPKLACIEVAAVVREVFDLLEFVARRRAVAMELRPQNSLPRLMADGAQLQQVVLNLLYNALHATPAGGHITVTIAPAQVTFPGQASPTDGIRVEVSDTGCGMTEEVLSKLFEPFFTTRASEGGSGLGLAVVRAIVIEHGGIVRVTSQPGAGSCFTVELPLTVSHATEAAR